MVAAAVVRLLAAVTVPMLVEATAAATVAVAVVVVADLAEPPGHQIQVNRVKILAMASHQASRVKPTRHVSAMRKRRESTVSNNVKTHAARASTPAQSHAVTLTSASLPVTSRQAFLHPVSLQAVTAEASAAPAQVVVAVVVAVVATDHVVPAARSAADKLIKRALGALFNALHASSPYYEWAKRYEINSAL